jgi:hypothetical protein
MSDEPRVSRCLRAGIPDCVLEKDPTSASTCIGNVCYEMA